MKSLPLPGLGLETFDGFGFLALLVFIWLPYQQTFNCHFFNRQSNTMLAIIPFQGFPP
jgi:hypothetical protein